eukprot:scaffold12292_cov112-Isochrysis_galbana.AAC.1
MAQSETGPDETSGASCGVVSRGSWAPSAPHARVSMRRLLLGRECLRLFAVGSFTLDLDAGRRLRLRLDPPGACEAGAEVATRGEVTPGPAERESAAC